MTIFAVATVALAFLNAFLKYYITLLKEHVRQKLTNWCHGELLRPNDMIFYKVRTLTPNLDPSPTKLRALNLCNS